MSRIIYDSGECRLQVGIEFTARHSGPLLALLELGQFGIQIVQSALEQCLITRIRGSFQIMQRPSPRQLQTSLFFAIDSFRGWIFRAIPTVGRLFFQDLVFDRLTFPTTCHI